MAGAVRAALMRLVVPLAAKVHYKEARHTLRGPAGVAAALQPLAPLLRGAQCLLVLEAQAVRGRRQRLVTVLAAVALAGTLALGARVAPMVVTATLLRPLQVAAAVVPLVMLVHSAAAAAAVSAYLVLAQQALAVWLLAAAVSAALAALTVLQQPQMQVLRAALMVVAVAVLTTMALRALLVVAALSASSGRVQHAPSPRLIRVTSDAKLQRGLVTLSAVSGSRARPVACASGRAYDWHGDSGISYVGHCCVHGSGLHRHTCWDHGLYSHVHTGLHHGHWRVIPNHG